MKNRKRTVLTISATALIMLATLIIYSCQKERRINFGEDEAKSNSKSNTLSKPASTAATFPCPCGPKPPGICPPFKNCAEDIMGDADSRNFEVIWTLCSGCGPNLPPNSTGKICHSGECGKMFIQIDNVPPCQQDCYGLQACITVTNIVCNGNSFSMSFISEDGTQVVNVTGDPFIQLDCTANGVTTHCEGNLTWQ